MLKKINRNENRIKRHKRIRNHISGTSIANKAKEKGIEEVVFDRSGYVYHGKVKALADAAREAGLKF